MEEECGIDVCIHIWKRNVRYKSVITYGRVIPDRCLYSHLEGESDIDVCIHIWKRIIRYMIIFTYRRGLSDI